MAATAPGTAKAGGTTASAPKTLPLGELKIMFFKFLEQQGYALPSEVDSVLGVGSSDSTIKNNVGGRGQSPCPSICSSVIRRSPQKVNSVNSTKTVASNKEATTSSVTLVKTTNVTGSKPSPPPRVKPPPPICLRDKSKWNHIASECSRLHINYNKAQNTRNGINITMSSIDDFRKLNSYLIKSDIPFHTYALEEERKVKAVLKASRSKSTLRT
ncbi:hypothetical protein EVAR_33899_1 [Eumeta japonica]|uniref:Uncharacterized protein n=1 Tax=Eumeta variegata TaxID=151549 RepID=A0A4C1WIB9_EUMVA|nr:hypothetical protein EVAR_33899_1 [Eumeta japonica]